LNDPIKLSLFFDVDVIGTDRSQHLAEPANRFLEVAPAELTLALIVASRRNITLEAERMKRGNWPCTLSHRLRSSTLGIYVLGAIGALVAEGGKGLGMNVLVFARKNSLEKAAAAGYEAARSKAALFECSDVLSISVRLRPETKGIVGPEDFARMKPTALFVQCRAR